jgi:ribonucleoside-diphosphate reductase subunit M2
MPRKVDIIDDSRRSESPDTICAEEEVCQQEVEEEESLEELRKKYVGEVNLPESASLVLG